MKCLCCKKYNAVFMKKYRVKDITWFNPNKFYICECPNCPYYIKIEQDRSFIQDYQQFEWVKI